MSRGMTTLKAFLSCDLMAKKTSPSARSCHCAWDHSNEVRSQTTRAPEGNSMKFILS